MNSTYRLNNTTRNPYLETFILAFLIALSILLPYMILDKGLFLFYGDYCVQQVPFYSLAHDAIRSGNVLWNWNTDLGANFVGSYAFYLLGSPFFWLTIPLPSFLIPYMLGPLLALKIATAAVTSYAFIRRFSKTHEFAALGALLYAFSSYSIYNIFFNHFHEPMAFFPLLLIALEELMIHNRKAVFALAVCLNAFVNYIFFVSEVVFLILYFALRLASGDWKITRRKFFSLAFESIIGVGISAVLLLPAVMAIINNPRTSTLLSGWNLLLYNWNQRYPDILHSLFFPQDLPSRPNFFPDSNANWSSVAAWLPMFSMTGALSFIIAKRGHWLKRILCVSFVMAMIPGLNALFVLLNDDYYARWFYMPVLMLCLATVIAFEDPEIDIKPGLRWTFSVTAAFALAIGLIPKVENGTIKLGLEQYPDKFIAYVAIVILGLAALFFLSRKYGKHTIGFANASTIALALIICIYGNFFIATGKALGWNGSWFKSTAVEGASKIKLDETRFYRIDVLNGIDNQGMFWKLPTINAFQSVVPASIMEFYDSIGLQRDVASRPSENFMGLRSFLSVRYVFDSQNNASLTMPGWVKYKNELGFTVWKNSNYIPMGFTYDRFVNQKQYRSSGFKDMLLLKAIVLNNEQIAKYSSILSLYNTADADFSDTTLAADCAARRREACSDFKTTNSGFTADINLSKENLVFFSVPYDSGWSATVNGKQSNIEKVNVGFMAVKCGKGGNSIRFTYKTPGLSAGFVVSLVSLTALILYLLFNRLKSYKPPRKTKRLA